MSVLEPSDVAEEFWNGSATASYVHLKNHVSPVRFWPSAQNEFPSEFTKRHPRKPGSNTVKPLLYGQKEPGMGWQVITRLLPMASASASSDH